MQRNQARREGLLKEKVKQVHADAEELVKPEGLRRKKG